jgi:hypothetical protein
MKISKNFIRFAAICGFLTVFTTLGIHLFFSAAPTDFEARALLFRDSAYLFNRWWVIVHCLLVLVAMWGFFLVQYRKSIGFTGLGFLFFCVFAIAEIARQMFVLFYLNGLRAKYINETDTTIKALLKYDLSNFSIFSNSLFGLFILAFGLGNLCYGLSLWTEKGFGKILSWMLILWSLGSFTALANEFWANTTISKIIETYNYVYQPLMRLLLAWWVMKTVNRTPSFNKT